MIDQTTTLNVTNKIPRRTSTKRSRAFTLIEFIIVMVILTIVSLTSSLLLIQGFSAFSQGRTILEADWQARTALERMTRDIRAVRSAADISTATSSTFTFVDLNGNSISYTLTGTQLMRNSQALADGAQSLTFTYYDSTGAVTAQISAIKYIVISLAISYGNISFTVTTSAYPWNLT